jgi:hypothetical protein
MLEAAPTVEAMTRVMPVIPTRVFAHAYAPEALGVPEVMRSIIIPLKKTTTSVATPNHSHRNILLSLEMLFVV